MHPTTSSAHDVEAAGRAAPARRRAGAGAGAALRAARAVVAGTGLRGARLERERGAPGRWTFALRCGAEAPPRYALRVTRVADAGRLRGPGGRSLGSLLAEVSAEASWLAALARDGRVPAPRPVHAPGDPFPGGAAYAVDGATLGDDGAAYLVLCTRWARWARVWRPHARGTAGRVGAAVGALHDCAARFVAPPHFARPRWDVDRRAAADAADLEARAAHAGVGADDLAADDLAAVRAAARRAGAAARGAGPTGLIHGALDLEHVALARPAAGAAAAGQDTRPGAQVAFVDFDACGWGPFLYDVAGALRAFDGAADADALRAAFLDGYAAVRALPADAEAQLAAFGDAWALRDLAAATRGATAGAERGAPARVRTLLDRLRARAR